MLPPGVSARPFHAARSTYTAASLHLFNVWMCFNSLEAARLVNAGGGPTLPQLVASAVL